MCCPVLRVRVPFSIFQTKPCRHGSRLRFIFWFVWQCSAGIFAIRVRVGGGLWYVCLLAPLRRNGNIQEGERLPASGALYPKMCEAHVVVHPQDAFHLAKKI